MRRLTSFVIALAAVVSLSASARAASLIFETHPDQAGNEGDLCPAPCMEIHIFLDASGTLPDLTPINTLPIQSIQFDIKISNGATVATLWIPDEIGTPNNGQSDDANVFFRARHDFPSSTTLATRDIPWTLSSTVAKSPNASFDARVAHAAPAPFTPAGLKTDMTVVQGTATTPATPNCTADDPFLCDLVSSHIVLDQVYLGRFNATVTGTSINVGNFTGDGALLNLLKALNGNPDAHCDFVEGKCEIPVPTPEPMSVILLGAALAGLGFVRRRS
jgi:hypothetical protein